MEGFLVGLLFVSILVIIWAMCLAAWGPVCLPVLFIATICGALIAAS